MRALYILVVVAGMLPTFAIAQVQTLGTCLEMEDQSKERSNCYDENRAGTKQVSAPAKKVNDCRFLKEEDERLNCFNRFVEASSKKNTSPQTQSP